MIQSDTTGWKQALRSRAFVVHMSASLSILLLLAIFIGGFFESVQSVEGSQLRDPLLALLPVRDMSLIIFGVIYGALVVGLIYLAGSPYLLLRAIEAYVVLTFFRMLMMFLLPLEPDKSIVPLVDPFVDQFFYDGRVITKDLFFSGHTALLALLAMVVGNTGLKYVFGIAALIVATLLLVQHAHYSVDVMAAPLFSWLSLVVARQLTRGI